MLLVPSDGVCVVGKGRSYRRSPFTLNLGLRIRPELPVEKSGRVMRIWAELGLGALVGGDNFFFLTGVGLFDGAALGLLCTVKYCDSLQAVDFAFLTNLI